MRDKFYKSKMYKIFKLELENLTYKENLELAEKENQRLNEELERFKKLYQEVFEETIRLMHSEHKEKSMGEAIENELKRIIRQGHF